MGLLYCPFAEEEIIRMITINVSSGMGNVATNEEEAELAQLKRVPTISSKNCHK